MRVSRRRFAFLATLLVAVNAFFWVAQSGFALPFGNTFLSLSLVAGAFILFHQFFSGKLLIEYDRLWWFLAVGLASACSLVTSSGGAKSTAYAQFVSRISRTGSHQLPRIAARRGRLRRRARRQRRIVL